MTQFRIGSRANDAWDFQEPGRPASSARVVDLPGLQVAPGWFRWVAHATCFLVASAEDEPSHERLIEHLGVSYTDCTLGELEVVETENGLDVVFSAYDVGPRLESRELTDRIETWLRAGASPPILDSGPGGDTVRSGAHFEAGPIEDLRRRAQRIGALVLKDSWLREHVSPADVDRVARKVADGEDAAYAYAELDPEDWSGATEPDGWWGDAAAAVALLGVLAPLKLRDGWSLGTYAHRDRMGGHGLTFARPLGVAVLSHPLPSPGASEPQVPEAPSLAAVLEWDLRDPSGFLMASIALRELEQLGGFWHGEWWATETLLAGRERIPELTRVDHVGLGDELPDFSAFEFGAELPEQWDPQVRHEDDGRVTVEMYTYRGRNGERIWRHIDRYPSGGGSPERQAEAVARGGFGYVY